MIKPNTFITLYNQTSHYKIPVNLIKKFINLNAVLKIWISVKILFFIPLLWYVIARVLGIKYKNTL